MSKIKTVALLSLALAVILAALPSFAAGPVYDELPDLGGQEVIVAVENQYIPFQFVDSRAPEQAIGFEYDVVNEACRRINCTPVYETTTFELQLAGVQDGTYDMAMNGLFIFPDRQEIYDFSTPYLQSGTYMLARADEDRFTGIEDFISQAEAEDLRFGVQANSFGQEIASSIHPIPEGQVVTFDDFNALLVALLNGDIDAMVVDAFAGEYVGSNADRFKLVGDKLVDSLDIAFIFEKDGDLDEAFTAAIESMKADGYIDYLYHKWAVDFQVLGE
jgi:polar amino acid transport system substrate-binding protein